MTETGSSSSETLAGQILVRLPTLITVTGPSMFPAGLLFFSALFIPFFWGMKKHLPTQHFPAEKLSHFGCHHGGHGP